MFVSSHFAPVTSDRIQKGEHQNLPPVHSGPGVLLGCHQAELLDPCSTQCWQQLLIEIGQFHAEVPHQNIISKQASLQTSTAQNWTPPCLAGLLQRINSAWEVLQNHF